jgi:predicted membrane protein
MERELLLIPVILAFICYFTIMLTTKAKSIFLDYVSLIVCFLYVLTNAFNIVMLFHPNLSLINLVIWGFVCKEIRKMINVKMINNRLKF